MSKSNFVPNPDQIAEACGRIQASWSEREREKRLNSPYSAVKPKPRWQAPEYRERDLGISDRTYWPDN